jgi:hypothetical protein
MIHQIISKRITDGIHVWPLLILHYLGFRLIFISLSRHIVLIIVTPTEMLICYTTCPHKIMKSHTCTNDLGLLLRCIRWDLLQDPPLHFQCPKWPLNNIPKRRVCVIEELFFTFWLGAVSKLLEMVLGSLVRSKVTQPVWIPRVH